MEKQVNEQGEVLKPCILTPRKNYVGKPTSSGDKYQYGVKLTIDPITGEKLAEVGDKIDLDAYIQASAAFTDIASIVERLKAGDSTVINVKAHGFEGDVAMLPHNINDVVAAGGLSEKARQSFDALPDEVKALFDDDSSKFFDAVITNKVDEIIKSYKPVEVKEEIEDGQAN